MRNRKSDFYYKLKDLKKNIKVYKGIFKGKTSTHYKVFLKR